MSPSRYKEVILLPQQTLAGERRPTTGDPKTGRRRQGGRPKSRPRPAGSHPVHNSTAARPWGNIPQAGGRRTGHPGEGAPAPLTWPHRVPRPARPKLSPRKAAHHRRKGVIPSTVADQGSFRRGEAGATRAGRQPAAREPAPPRREARSASRRCGAGQRQGLSSPPVISQSAGRSHRRRSRRAPRPLKKSARARLAAEGKLGPPTPAVEIRE